jgi:hypothetical protein
MPINSKRAGSKSGLESSAVQRHCRLTQLKPGAGRSAQNLPV